MQQTGLLAKYQFNVDVYQIVVEKRRESISRTLRESLAKNIFQAKCKHARTHAHTHTHTHTHKPG